MFRCIAIILLNTAALAQPVLPIFEIQNEVTLIDNGAAQNSFPLNTFFKAEPIDSQVVRFVAEYSTDNLPAPTIVTKNLDFALFSNRTPITRTNFLHYVNTGAYMDSFIHRGVQNFVIQGGGFHFDYTDGITIEPVETVAPIVNEPGISNTLGTISMAKTSLGPDTATSQWFVSTGGNSSNLDFQNGGFTVFARVTKDTLPNALLFNNPSTFPSYDLRNVIGDVFSETPLHISAQSLTVDKFINFTSVSLVPLPADQAGTITTFTYQILTPPDPALATASLDGQNILFTPNGTTTGETSITIKATDSVGNEVVGTIPIFIADTFESWKNNNFSGDDLLDPQISGPNADPNNDGISNLQAFAQGLGPDETIHPATVINPADIRITYLEQTDIMSTRITVQRSTSLQSNDWSTITGTLISAIDTPKTNQRSVTVSFPKSGDMAFYRLAFEIIPE
jgi:cyclophilin family peptidyl-prolyl cis-trans isomerase